MKTIDICPTILNASQSEDFLNLLLESNEDTLEKIVYIHLDIMDKDFVKGEGRALEEAKTINEKGFVNDIHLMVNDVKKYIDKALRYNPGVLTIHFEIDEFEKNIKYLNKIRKSRKYPYFDIGVSINPNTKIDDLTKYKDLFDLLLVMGVEPGYGAQVFIKSTYEKIQKARLMFEDKIIQVDGGINDSNIGKIRDAGADRVAIGSYLTKNTNLLELKECFEKLRKELRF